MINPVTKVKNGKGMIHVKSKSSRRTVISQITVSKNLEKYFRHLTFYSRYDEEIYANESVLNIPALSILLPLAWITGSDVYIDELDHTFAESMNDLQQEYKKMYPRAPFKTRLIAENLLEDKSSSEGVALLFSGGVDSTHSMFSNMHLNPRLIIIFGIWDIPIKNIELQDRIKRVYLDFTDQVGLKLNIIRTNALEVLDIERVDHFFYRFHQGRARDYWIGLGFSLGHLGQVAPLSERRFNQLLISGGGRRSRYFNRNLPPYASIYNTDEKIGWTNLQVKYLGGIHRFKKIFDLKKFEKNHRVNLKVCGLPGKLAFNSLNCSRCEKCFTTITPLTIAGIDPNEWGFNVDTKSWSILKSLFEKKKIPNGNLKVFWKPLQKTIPNKMERDLYGSKKFFEWFKTRDLSEFEKTPNNPLSLLYYKTPYPIAHVLRKIFHQKFRIT
jgi:hypothetical protein